MAKSGVFLVTREQQTEKTVSLALDASDRLEGAGVCRAVPALAARLEEKGAPLALIDIDPAPEEMLKSLEKLAGRFPQTRFVVLSSELRNDLVLEAMQAGARHFLVKESLREKLVDVLLKLAPLNSGHGAAQGALVPIFSASGGCGATTLAVNVANELHLATGERVLLVDMDSAYGSVSGYLDVRGQYGLADILGSAGRVDAELVRSTAQAYSEGLSVLLSPASTDFSHPAPMDFSSLEDVLRACRSAYEHTVVDAPRIPMDVAAALASRARVSLLVLQLTVKDIRTARQIWRALRDRGITADQVKVVVNRFRRRRQMLGLEEVSKALPELEVERVPNDFRAAIAALNYGQPAAQAAPRSTLRRSVQDLVARITQTEAVRA